MKLVDRVRLRLPKSIKRLFRPLWYKFLVPLVRALSNLISGRTTARKEYLQYGLEKQAVAVYRFLNRAVDIYHYQPLYGIWSSVGKSMQSAVRGSADRWAVIESELPQSGFALDIGCQNGFFSFLLAQQGFITMGIERDEPSVRVCQILALANKPLPVSFLSMDINAVAVHQLPEADVVLCLSIFHNWVRELGFKEADQIMRSVAVKTRTALFFETGQNDQVEANWAKDLDFMGADPKGWIREYLLGLGFEHVKELGRFCGTTKQSSERVLFVAYKEKMA